MHFNHSQPTSDLAAGVTLVYVGSIVPDQPSYTNGPAFNRAGNMFQENLLLAIQKAGLPASLILSQQPVPTFPKSCTVWVNAGSVVMETGLTIQLLPFLNFPFFRQLSVGLEVI